MKNNKFLFILITLFIMVILVIGCSSTTSVVIIPEEGVIETPEATVPPEPTQTQVPVLLNFLWTWEDIGPYLGKFLDSPAPYFDASEYLERMREEKYNFYSYVVDIHESGLARGFGPTDYLDAGPVCEHFRSKGMEIVDDLLCNKIINSKDLQFRDEDDPLFEEWAYHPEVDYDTIMFLTVEGDHNCFFEKEGGIILIDEEEQVSFFEDEDFPFVEFTSDENDLVEAGFTLIDRRGETPEGKCNFYDFMEEITLK